jgi:hypothetical protein
MTWRCRRSSGGPSFPTYDTPLKPDTLMTTPFDAAFATLRALLPAAALEGLMRRCAVRQGDELYGCSPA